MVAKINNAELTKSNKKKYLDFILNINDRNY